MGFIPQQAGPHSSISSKSDCWSRGCEFDSGPAPYSVALLLKYLLLLFSSFRWFKKSFYQLQDFTLSTG